VDDYWVQYGHAGPDPYETNGWAEHALEDCTGDFMKTSRAASGNSDGGTSFVNYADGSPLYASDMELFGIDEYDGGYGFKLFYESRGYTVNTMYNQYIHGYDGNTQGFTYPQYKAEIDAGRPVMIHVEGHTMVGVGYDDSSSSLMYIHDTWNYDTHTMEWGNGYQGMAHVGVTIVQLQAPPTPDSPGNLTAMAVSPKRLHLEWADNSTNETGFKIWRSPNGSTGWLEIDAVGADVTTYPDIGLSPDTAYYYRLQACHGPACSGYSNTAHDTTWVDYPHAVYVPLVSRDYGILTGRVDLRGADP
jgi:hypothetical protein